MDVALDAVVAAAGRLKPADRRGAVHRLRGGIVLIDDSYNSSPSALAPVRSTWSRKKTRVDHARSQFWARCWSSGSRQIDCTRNRVDTPPRRGCDLLVTIGGDGARRLADAAIAAGMPPSAVTYFERSDLAAAEVARRHTSRRPRAGERDPAGLVRISSLTASRRSSADAVRPSSAARVLFRRLERGPVHHVPYGGGEPDGAFHQPGPRTLDDPQACATSRSVR